MFIVASFPRSGNHLVRFFIEYMTGRPTLGCFNSPQDIPIHCNDFPEEPAVLAHVGGDPIAHKAHFVRELRHLVQVYPIAGIILIRRHPIEAIGSHHRKVEGRNFRAVYGSIRRYAALDRYFRLTNMPKINLDYHRLTSSSPDMFLPELDKLVAFMPPDALKEPYLNTLRREFGRLSFVNARATGRTGGAIRTPSANHYQQNISPWVQTMMMKLIAIHGGQHQ